MIVLGSLAGRASRSIKSSLHCCVPLQAAPGLSGLVAAHLGAPLDKTLQCSGWEDRPLAPPQVAYAAADAVVLLHLLPALAAAAQPAASPLCGAP